MYPLVKVKKLHAFAYKYDKGAGPLLEIEFNQAIKTGNCRLAVQDYFYVAQGLYLKPDEILLPYGYKHTGVFINFRGLRDLKQGDIIYAEKFRNKNSEIIYKEKDKYKNEDEWIRYFHTAIYLGNLDEKIESLLPVKPAYPKGTPVIWHSSFIAGGTAVWSVEKFCYYYQPVAAKRISYNH